MFGVSICASGGALARGYPTKPVKIVAGFPAGGGADVVARIVAESLTRKTGGSFVVLNKPGAGAMLAAEEVAKSAPDGYTLLLGSSGELTIAPPFYGRSPYDPVRDFVPIAFLGASPIIMLAHPKFPANGIADIIAQAKASPGRLTIATGGHGTPPDLAARQLKLLAGIDCVIVPYKGGAPAVTDAVAGHVPLVFIPVSTALPFVRSGDLKPLAVISKQRSPLLPEVPSTAEAGLDDYAAASWFGLFGPTSMPLEIVTQLREAIGAMMTEPSIREKYAMLGFDLPTPSDTPAALSDRIGIELARWTDVIKRSGVKPN
jgi:tripartite-type tricarboxylate transporter receptor subunit TctC